MKGRDRNLCYQVEFVTSRDLIDFGQSLIDLVIPGDLSKNIYDKKYLNAIVDDIKKFDFLKPHDLKNGLKREIDGSKSTDEISRILDKYQETIKTYKKNKNNKKSRILPFADFFDNLDVVMIEQMVNFGLKLIMYGNEGYKAYWHI